MTRLNDKSVGSSHDHGNCEPCDALKTEPSICSLAMQKALWRAAGEAAEQGDIIKALLLFEAGRVA